MVITSVGARVLAVVSIENNVAKVLGEGVFVGDEVPSAVEFPHLKMFSDNNIANPRINLDSGGVVWGCECWWGDIESMKRRLSSCEVVSVTAKEMRAPVKPKATVVGDYSSDDVQSL